MDIDSAPGRSIDIELGDGDVVTVDIDILDPDPIDILELLREANGSVWLWLRFASEYWRKGLHSGAEQFCDSAVTAFTSIGKTSELWPIHLFKANTQLTHSRKAPKIILNTARRKVISDGTTKETYHKRITELLNLTDTGSDESETAYQLLSTLTRAMYLLTTRSLDDALSYFNNILSLKPTNIPALLGKGRVYYATRDYTNALQHFQKVLTLAPNCKPDPRMGIGLCLWAMGNHEKARTAWERSLEVNPDDWPGHVIIGLDDINRSKDSKRPDDERAAAYSSGFKHVEKAFKGNNKSAAAANALSEFFLRKGDAGNSLKLAERTIQFADTFSLLSEGHLRIARVLHSEGSSGPATKHYQTAAEGQQKHVLATLSLAQLQLQSSEIPAAIHSLDGLVQASDASSCLEGTIMLASLLAHPRPGVSSTDIARDKERSREMFEQVVKVIDANEMRANDGLVSRSIRNLGDDVEMHLEIARLWQHDNTDKMSKALKEALRIGQSNGQTDPRLINNLGAIRHMEGDFQMARSMYEDALGLSSQSGMANSDDISASILYNLARVYESQDDLNMAKDAYDKLLQRHPEYVDARIRLAQMLKDLNQINDAHDLLKQALVSQSHNLNLRACYTHFLLQSNLIRPAKDFVFATLKDHDKHDLYSLCAAGHIQYQQARENRDVTPEGLKNRRRTFERAIEFYEKALSIDPQCAVAAQGLAIVTAEDVLGSFGSQAEDSRQRLNGAREALDIFTKVRESIADGSVYANMGHCYYARDEYDRAIESYETASKKFYNHQDITVLICLSRTHYAKANKDQSYAQMNLALTYAQKALHLLPHDKAVLYNIAMIQQKAAEMLFTLDPSKRTGEDLKKAIEHAEHAQSLFSSLASDKSSYLPYNRDLADQRRKYGESMLRKADEHTATQETYEADAKEKLDLTRQRRQEEKERILQLEVERTEKLKAEAEELGLKRREAREAAMAWTAAAKAESDDERDKKVSKRSKKGKADAESGDEALPGGEAKKKRKTKRKTETNGNSELHPGDEDEALFSGGEDADRPKKRITKKRVIRDEDEDEITAGPRRKQFKSKETISDSDEEMD